MAADLSVTAAIDHLVLVAGDRDGALASLRAAFGDPVWASADADNGTRSDFFPLGGPLLELLAIDRAGPVAARLSALLETEGEGVMSLAYRSVDIEATAAGLRTAGLAPSEIGEGASLDLATGRTRRWRRVRLPSETTPGLRHFTIEPIDPPAWRNGGPRLRQLTIETPEPGLLARIVSAHADPAGPEIRLVPAPGAALSRVTRLAFADGGGLPPRIVGVAIAAI